MSDWRPISSAPKNGERILLAEGRGPSGFITTGHWSTSVWNAPGKWIVEENRSDATILNPLHWMPIPGGPKGKPSAFDKIAAGLSDALAFAKGDTTRGKIVRQGGGA